MTLPSLPQEAQPDNSILGNQTQALQDLFRGALQGLMERDIEGIIGAAHYERAGERRDIRNGYRPRRFDSRMGSLPLQIPRARETIYMPAFLEHRERTEKALIALIQDAYIAGVSTRKIEKLVADLGVTSLSKSQVSEYCKEIETLVTAFRRRPLTESYPYVFFDAVYEKVRVDGLVQSQAAVVAYGVTSEGKREPIGLEIFDTESFESWSTFFRGLIERGLKGVRLVISDAHAGLVKAIGTMFLGATWQRCKVHFMRNVLAPVTKKYKDAFSSDLKEIYYQSSLEKAMAIVDQMIEKYGKTCSQAIEILLAGVEDTLRYVSFPSEHKSKISSTNPIERLNKEIRRRTKVVGVFPSIASALRLIGAVLLEQTEEWATQGYINADSMKLIPVASSTA